MASASPQSMRSSARPQPRTAAISQQSWVRQNLSFVITAIVAALVCMGLLGFALTRGQNRSYAESGVEPVTSQQVAAQTTPAPISRSTASVPVIQNVAVAPAKIDPIPSPPAPESQVAFSDAPAVKPVRKAVAKFDPTHLGSTKMWVEKLLVPLEAFKASRGDPQAEKFQLGQKIYQQHLRSLKGTQVSWEFPVIGFASQEGDRLQFEDAFGQLIVRTTQFNTVEGSNYLVVGRDFPTELAASFASNGGKTVPVAGIIVDITVDENAPNISFLLDLREPYPEWYTEKPLFDTNLSFATYDHTERWLNNTIGSLVPKPRTPQERMQLAREMMLGNGLGQLTETINQRARPAYGKTAVWLLEVTRVGNHDVTVNKPFHLGRSKGTPIKLSFATEGSTPTQYLSDGTASLIKGIHLTEADAAILKPGDLIIVEGRISDFSYQRDGSNKFFFGVTFDGARVVR